MSKLLSLDREDFLGKMYESSWDNVSRASDSVWKIFAAYTAIIAGLGVAYDTIGDFGFLFILTIFSYTGIAVALNANSWFARNMGILSNIEKEFLDKKDFDHIIPKRWVQGKVQFFNREVWWILILLFSFVILGANLIFFPKLSDDYKNLQISLIIGGFLASIIYGAFLACKHRNFVNSAKGKII